MSGNGNLHGILKDGNFLKWELKEEGLFAYGINKWKMLRKLQNLITVNKWNGEIVI